MTAEERFKDLCVNKVFAYIFISLGALVLLSLYMLWTI